MLECLKWLQAFFIGGKRMISFFLTAKRLLGAIVVLWKEKVFLSLVTTLLLINLSGTLFYSSIEGWTYFDAFYFSWVSLIPTSIDLGYAPMTTFGKVFTMMYLVVGMGIMLALLAMVAKAVLGVDDENTKRTKKRLEE